MNELLLWVFIIYLKTLVLIFFDILCFTGIGLLFMSGSIPSFMQ